MHTGFPERALTREIAPCRRSISDIFRIHVVASSTPPTSPLITLSNTTFFHVRHGGLWLVAVCKHVSPDFALCCPVSICFACARAGPGLTKGALVRTQNTECQRCSRLRVHVSLYQPRPVLFRQTRRGERQEQLCVSGPRVRLPRMGLGLTEILPGNRLIYELLDGKGAFVLDSAAFRLLISSGDIPPFCFPSLARRDPRFRVPAKFRERHAQDVYHDRGDQV